MPAGNYTYTFFIITGSPPSSFAVVSSFTIDLFDSDDDQGIASLGLEIGSDPVITGLSAGAPAGLNIGDTINLGAAYSEPFSAAGPIFATIEVNGTPDTTLMMNMPGTATPLVVGERYTFKELSATKVEETAPPCFCAGTEIITNRGSIPVEDLQIGDRVLTMDNGLQEIRWIGSTNRAAFGGSAPILFRKGALGNERDLRVSPQHRMLLNGWKVELNFGESEVLVPAKSLIGLEGVCIDEGGQVTYYHMLFDEHQVVFAEGIPSESYHPGDNSYDSFDKAAKEEILSLFPELAVNDGASYGSTARMTLSVREASYLAAA